MTERSYRKIFSSAIRGLNGIFEKQQVLDVLAETAKSQIDAFLENGHFFWLLDRAPDVPIRYMETGSVRMKHPNPICETTDMKEAIENSITEITVEFGQDPSQQDLLRYLELTYSTTSSCDDFLKKFRIAYDYSESCRNDKTRKTPTESTAPEPVVEVAVIDMVKIEDNVGVSVWESTAVPDAVSMDSVISQQSIPPVPEVSEALFVAPDVPAGEDGVLASASLIVLMESEKAAGLCLNGAQQASTAFSRSMATTSSPRSRSSEESATKSSKKSKKDNAETDGATVTSAVAPTTPPPSSPASMEPPVVLVENPTAAPEERPQSPEIDSGPPKKKNKTHHHSSSSLLDRSLEIPPTSTQPEAQRSEPKKAKPRRPPSKSKNRDLNSGRSRSPVEELVRASSQSTSPDKLASRLPASGRANAIFVPCVSVFNASFAPRPPRGDKGTLPRSRSPIMEPDRSTVKPGKTVWFMRK